MKAKLEQVVKMPLALSIVEQAIAERVKAP